MNEKLKSNNLNSIINRVCGDCGRAGAESNEIKLDGGVHTYAMGICDFCGEKKHLTSVRHFGYPDFNLVKKIKLKTRQEKINKIYEKIADKIPTLGCKTEVYSRDDIIISYYNKKLTFLNDENGIEVVENYEPLLIGHPVMIGDVYDFFEKSNFTKYKKTLGINGNDVNFDKSLAILWKEKRKPIEDQSDDCIDFVYDLIS